MFCPSVGGSKEVGLWIVVDILSNLTRFGTGPITSLPAKAREKLIKDSFVKHTKCDHVHFTTM